MSKDAPLNAYEGGNAESVADMTLCTALDIAENMLKCGAEIQRVEDTVSRICHAYGAAHVEVFSIPTLIISSVRMKDGTYSSQIRRVYGSANDLARLEALNEVSRYICANTPPHKQVQTLIKEAKKASSFPKWLVLIGAMLSTGAFAMFFGGTLLDGAFAALVGGIMSIVNDFLAASRFGVSKMARSLVVSFVGGAITSICIRLGMPLSLDKVVIGAIMLLIPGLAFGTSLRDMLCGDTLSGIMGVIQALLLTVMIATGFVVSIFLFGGAV